MKAKAERMPALTVNPRRRIGAVAEMRDESEI
jgi:hypothetical protein